MSELTAKAAGGKFSEARTWEPEKVPTNADDCFLSAGSGNVTIGATSVCRSLNCTGYTGTLKHEAFTLSIGDGTAGAGNIALKLVAGMTYTPDSGGFASLGLAVQGHPDNEPMARYPQILAEILGGRDGRPPWTRAVEGDPNIEKVTLTMGRLVGPPRHPGTIQRTTYRAPDTLPVLTISSCRIPCRGSSSGAAWPRFLAARLADPVQCGRRSSSERVRSVDLAAVA